MTPRMESAPLFGILATYSMKTVPVNRATIIGMNGNVTGVICATPPTTNATTA